jgi:hypothetical protein
MASKDSVEVRKLLKKGVVRQVLQDTAIGLRLRPTSSAGTVTTVAVTQATSVVLTTSGGGVDTYLFSAHSTLGSLVDAINADGIFEAVVVDALRSENPDDFFITSAGIAAGTDDNGVVCYDLLVDLSAAVTMACCLSPLKPNFDMPEGHRVHLKQITYLIDNTAGAATLKIYKRKGSLETLILSTTNVDNTLTNLSWASGEGYITAGEDEDIVVFFDGTVGDQTGTTIALIGEYE